MCHDFFYCSTVIYLKEESMASTMVKKITHYRAKGYATRPKTLVATYTITKLLT